MTRSTAARPSLVSRATSALVARLPLIGPLTRRVSALIAARSWDAAQITRLNRELFSKSRITTQDQEFAQDSSNLRRVTRQILRNSALAASGQANIRERAIGFLGVIPTVQTENADLNESIEAAFREDMDSLGLLGESWYELQRIWLNEYVAAGEAFAYTVIDRGQFRVVNFEAEQLAVSVPSRVLAQNELFADGIVYDLLGRPVSYVITHTLPGSWGYGTRAMSGAQVEMPADRVAHMFVKDRPTQSRGVSPLAPVLITLSDVTDTNQAELLNIKVGSFFGVFTDISSDESSMVSLGAEENPEANTGSPQHDAAQQIKLQPGMYHEVYGKPTMVDPSRPGEHYGPFISMLGKFVAAALRLPYAALTNDTSQETYSSAKIAHINNAPGTEERQRLLVLRMLTPIFRGWLEYAIIQGRIVLPSQNHMSPAKRITVAKIVRSLVWQYPAQPLPEPLKEMLASQIALGLGTKSWSQLCAEQGVDPREAARQIAADQKLLGTVGLSIEKVLALSGAAIGPALAAIAAEDNPAASADSAPPAQPTKTKAAR